MSVQERLRALAQRAPSTISHLETEEATKTALIMPFLAALGYDVFNPLEVIPEFTADVGTKKGEKVDYAIKRDDQIVMLVEAKKASCALDQVHASQLYRYFSVTAARVGVLTNGVIYQFYSDLEEPNKMDERPFFELNLLELKDAHLVEVAKLSRERFDVDGVLSAAHDLKALSLVRAVLERQAEEPDEDFVRFCYQKANPSGRFIASAREQYTPIVKKAFTSLISDRVAARLRSALASSESPSVAEEPAAAPDETPTTAPDDAGEDGIVTTEEELDGFRIVKAIICAEIEPERITYRDAKSYFSVLIDDNNRKAICRLHLNRSKKYIGLFDEGKSETRHPLEKVDDLYRFSAELRTAAQRYANGTKTAAAEPSEPGA